MSNDKVEFPMFALKTLSKYLGAYPLRWNAEKVMLLEKNAIIRIFSQGSGVYALRSKYYLAYAAYGLACGIQDPLLLEDYGKTKLLKQCRPRFPFVIDCRMNQNLQLHDYNKLILMKLILLAREIEMM